MEAIPGKIGGTSWGGTAQRRGSHIGKLRDCPLEERLIWQKWLRPYNPTMLCHWLGDTQENHGLNTNAAVNPQSSAAGGHQLTALLIATGNASFTAPQLPHWSQNLFMRGMCAFCLRMFPKYGLITMDLAIPLLMDS